MQLCGALLAAAIQYPEPCAQNNQWDIQLGDDLSQSPFELAVAACKGVVMILDGGAVALTRIWCLVSHLFIVLALLRLSCCCRV